MNICFENAVTEDAVDLTAISVRSFHTDFVAAGRSAVGGPPGYDSVAFHEQMIRDASGFFKIMVDDTLIGGFWFMEKEIGRAYLYRIFIDPDFHYRGIGIKSFEFLLKQYPGIKEWSLQTPVWNSRTPKFYDKLGFELVEKSDRFLFFIKRNDRE